MNECNNWKKQVLLFFLLWTPIPLYIMLPQFMYSIIYFICTLAMFAVSHVNKKLALKLVVVNVVASVIFIITLILSRRGDYFFTRLFAFVNPDADPNGAGYMYTLVMDILSHAVWFGNRLYKI
ncbi:FtsW/RodA/SpoVE family cell cycle protein [Cytobacillus sp. FJAT-53684]|uniref:FtsW/RodA/SpoVE family cell cycle protein n=1 Tax=Cytobacillus mangrovibacter TaxID=3299024 RepID=A0ABW6JT60_9BACI